MWDTGPIPCHWFQYTSMLCSPYSHVGWLCALALWVVPSEYCSAMSPSTPLFCNWKMVENSGTNWWNLGRITQKASPCNCRAQGLMNPTLESHTSYVGLKFHTFQLTLQGNNKGKINLSKTFVLTCCEHLNISLICLNITPHFSWFCYD